MASTPSEAQAIGGRSAARSCSPRTCPSCHALHHGALTEDRAGVAEGSGRWGHLHCKRKPRAGVRID